MTKTLEAALFQHFSHQKLEIAYAIDKPFPFFEGLWDKSFISDRQYGESMEACRNLVPIAKVVHSTLTQLETRFSVPLLKTLFSRINLVEYPKLNTICQSFRNGLMHVLSSTPMFTTYEEWNRATEVPVDLAGGCFLQALPLPPPPQLSPPSQQPHVSRDGEPSRSAPAEHLGGLVQEERGTSVTNDNLMSKVSEEEDSQEMPNGSGTVQANIDWGRLSLDQVAAKGPCTSQPRTSGKSPETRKWAQQRKRNGRPIGVANPLMHARTRTRLIREDFAEPNDAEEPQEASTTASGKKALLGSLVDGLPFPHPSSAFLHTPPYQTPHSVASSSLAASALTPRAHLAECTLRLRDSSQVAPRKKRKRSTWSTPKNRHQKRSLPKRSSEKCIQNKEGVWFTPKEFELEGKKKNSKDWKRSLHCGGQTVRQLLEIRDYGEPFKEALWLILVTERLAEEVYVVAWLCRMCP
ncbi:Sp110 nuclear body protein [Tupaia chinensis]|uniref:Sp110 nuclear body protein n=1 Tax=Tupaia chinensis TaxID=246437 RepID=L9L993_TUPCH|nr:Sp110 nuclear body protein [Tupaia chinensis]